MTKNKSSTLTVSRMLKTDDAGTAFASSDLLPNPWLETRIIWAKSDPQNVNTERLNHDRNTA